MILTYIAFWYTSKNQIENAIETKNLVIIAKKKKCTASRNKHLKSFCKIVIEKTIKLYSKIKEKLALLKGYTILRFGKTQYHTDVTSS